MRRVKDVKNIATQALFSDDDENRQKLESNKETTAIERRDQTSFDETKRKAPGPDGIADKLLRFGWQMTLNKPHGICVGIRELAGRIDTHNLYPSIHER